MRLFLKIDISDWQQRGYENSLGKYAPSLASDLISADIDSQSEASVVDLVNKLTDQSEKIFVCIHAHPNAPIGSCVKLLNHLFRIETKIHAIILSGKNSIVEKMITPFQERVKAESDPEKIKLLLEEFAMAKP